ncbi:MAG: hypothetical protein JXQ85_05135 [Cognatishimia sp.]|uniref:hypothetical protein n=1 Tax=Cognatishimia sp. TaxID=2211648 RepID=UPI003B8B4396
MGFVWRAPFVIFAAFGFLSLSTGGGVMQVDSNVEAWIKIWNSITIPFWRFVLWPIENLVSEGIPELILNWLSIGVIVYGMALRYHKSVMDYSERAEAVSKSPISLRAIFIFLGFLFLFLIIWPAYLFMMSMFSVLLLLLPNPDGEPVVDEARRSFAIFWETAVWFFLIVAINYALLFRAGELRW